MILHILASCAAACGTGASLEGDASADTPLHEDLLSDDGELDEDASTPSTAWSRTYGSGDHDMALSLLNAPGGGFVAAGYTMPELGFHILVLRLDDAGDMLWAKTYAAQDRDTIFAEIRESSDNGFVAAGTIQTPLAPDQANSILAFKLDAEGTTVWQYEYAWAGMTLDEQAYAIEALGDGGHILGGSCGLTGSGTFWIMKLDARGAVAWFNEYTLDENAGLSCLRRDPGGGFVAVGRIYSLSERQSDPWIMRLDQEGAVLWQKRLRGEGMSSLQDAASLPGGGYVLAGRTMAPGEDYYDLWAVRIDASGQILWQEAYGGPYDDLAHALMPALDGAFMVAGESCSFTYPSCHAWILRLTGSGEVAWEKTYSCHGNMEFMGAVLAVPDAGFIAAGRAGAGGAGRFDVWVLKLDSHGSISTECPEGIGVSSHAAVSTTNAVAVDIHAAVQPVEATRTEYDLVTTDVSLIVDMQCSR